MKAILIIDKPDACYECPCYRQTHEGGLFEDCKATYIPLSPAEVVDIPEWCPLKPIPQKINVGEDELYEKQYMCFEGGWNACIEEIEK